MRTNTIVSLLLVLPVAHASDLGACVGQTLEAASSLAAAGLHISVVGKSCCSAVPAVTCAEDVEKIIGALTYSSNVLSEAVHSCGGPRDGCAQGVTKASESLTVLTQAATGLVDGVTKEKVQGLANELSLTVTALTDIASKCDSSDHTAENANIGHCVGHAMDAATQAAAAGITIDNIHNGCVKHHTDTTETCLQSGAFLVNAISTASAQSAMAAKACESNGLVKCAIDLSDASAMLSSASGGSIIAKEQADDDNQLLWLGDLAGIGPALGKAAEDLADSAKSCSRDDNNAQTQYGDCVSDSLSATTYVAAASVAIGQAVQECAIKCHKHIDHSQVAKCVTDISFVVQGYARAANEIIWATADCRKHPVHDVKCGSDISTSISAIAATAAASARLAKFAITDHLGEAADQLETLGLSLNSMSQAIGNAIGYCTRVPARTPNIVRFNPGLGRDGDYPEYNRLTNVIQNNVVQKWGWGSQAKKWWGQGPKDNHVIMSKTSVATAGTLLASAGMALVLVSVGIKVVLRRRGVHSHPRVADTLELLPDVE